MCGQTGAVGCDDSEKRTGEAVTVAVEDYIAFCIGFCILKGLEIIVLL